LKSKTKKKKMPQKSPTIADVASPGKTAPSANSRPIIVTNHTMLAGDPMLRGNATDTEPQPAAIVNRTARTIAPLDGDVSGDVLIPGDPEKTAQKETSAETLLPADKPEPALQPKVSAEQSTPAGLPETPKTPETLVAPIASPETEEPKTDADDTSPRDAEAETNEAEAKALAEAEARQQELESLIQQGTYAVPINAVQRQRSRAFVAIMCVLAVLLAVVLLDALLDANIINLSFNVPHTHILSAK
jgi:hypothetical protein